MRVFAGLKVQGGYSGDPSLKLLFISTEQFFCQVKGSKRINRDHLRFKVSSGFKNS